MNISNKIHRIRKMVPGSQLLMILTFLALPVFTSGCDSRSDRVDMEELKVFVLLLTKPTNLTLECYNSQVNAFQCANNTGLAGATEIYVSAMESAYSITVASPRDEAALCDSQTLSPEFPVPGSDNSNFSTGAKACFYECSGDYWSRMQIAGKCTAADYTSILSSTDEDYTTCLEECLGVGTVLFP